MTTSAEIAALRATLEAFLKSYDSATSDAASERKDMMRAISKLTIGQDKLAADMAEVKPVTDMVTGVRARLTGAMLVLGLVGAILWAGVQFFKQQIITWLGA